MICNIWEAHHVINYFKGRILGPFLGQFLGNFWAKVQENLSLE